MAFQQVERALPHGAEPVLGLGLRQKGADLDVEIAFEAQRRAAGPFWPSSLQSRTMGR